VLLPTIFLTVALMGGVRVAAETRAFLFIAPPLVALVLAVLLMLLFARGALVNLPTWLSGDNAPLTNISHALTLLALFFASAQAFNSVLPERGLFRWMFAFFFLWTLWNNQFAGFDARRLLRSLAALFSTAFILKHMLLVFGHLGGHAHAFGLSAENLHGERAFIIVKAHLPFRLRIIARQALDRDELRDGEADAAAPLQQTAKCHVRHARHRRQHERRADLDISDLKRLHLHIADFGLRNAD
jgi:hypothetical protein